MEQKHRAQGQTVHTELAALREEIENLKAENTWLREQLEPSDAVVLKLRALGLGTAEAKLAAALYCGRTLSYEHLCEIVALSEDTDPNLVKVRKCRAMQKLPALQIKTVWGVGYKMAPAGIAYVKALMETI